LKHSSRKISENSQQRPCGAAFGNLVRRNVVKLYKYKVMGKGSFPTDMLRYDSCWPSKPEDAEKILAPSKDATVVQVTSIKEPTHARWSSFGWSIGAVEKMTI
jgi:hypothetical protein